MNISNIHSEFRKVKLFEVWERGIKWSGEVDLTDVVF